MKGMVIPRCTTHPTPLLQQIAFPLLFPQVSGQIVALPGKWLWVGMRKDLWQRDDFAKE